MTNILEYLERSAQLFPEKPALVDERQSITFAQALENSRRVGSSLALSLAKGQPVAVYMEKSVENLCAFWGIVYAGGFYVSFNTQLPTSRLQQMQSVLQAPFVITDEEHRAALEEVFPPHRILLYQDLVKSAVDRALLAQIRQRHVDTAPLYANFTSGSTGVPKAVVVGHRSTLDFIDHFCPIFSITQKDVIANQAPFDFDVSVKDIYSALATGATLVLVPRPLFSQPQQLLDFLCEHRATTLIWAVSALCLITTVHGLDYRTPETVNKVLFSGEVMPAKHLKIWMEHLPRAQFVNLYGPTEITCNCTYHIIDRERSYPDGIPMGQALRRRPAGHVSQCGGRGVCARLGSCPGLLPQPGPDGRRLPQQSPQPMLSRAHLPHWRLGPVLHAGRASLLWPQGLPDQAHGPPYRAGRD